MDTTIRKQQTRIKGLKLPCSFCNEEKEETEFYFNPRRKRYDARCYACKRKKYKEYKYNKIEKKTYVITIDREVKPDGMSIEQAKAKCHIGDKIIVVHSDLCEKWTTEETIIAILPYGAMTLNSQNCKETYLWIDILNFMKNGKYISQEEQNEECIAK